MPAQWNRSNIHVSSPPGCLRPSVGAHRTHGLGPSTRADFGGSNTNALCPATVKFSRWGDASSFWAAAGWATATTATAISKVWVWSNRVCGVLTRRRRLLAHHSRILRIDVELEAADLVKLGCTDARPHFHQATSNGRFPLKQRLRQPIARSLRESLRVWPTLPRLPRREIGFRVGRLEPESRRHGLPWAVGRRESLDGVRIYGGA